MKYKIAIIIVLAGLIGLLYAYKKGVFETQNDEYAVLKLPDTIDTEAPRLHRVSEEVALGVEVGEDVIVAVGVALGLKVKLGDAEAVAVGVTVAVGVDVTVGVAVAVAAGGVGVKVIVAGAA